MEHTPFKSCQRCGLPHTSPPGLSLPSLHLTLPFLSLCSSCTAQVRGLEVCIASQPPSDRLPLSLCALSCLSTAPWHGEGLTRRTALRALWSCGRVLVGAPLGMALGAVQGSLGGLLGGGMAGGLGGVALGFDAGNACAGTGSKGASGSGSSEAAAAAAAAAAAGSSKPLPPSEAAAAPVQSDAGARSKAIARMSEAERAADAEAEAARVAAAPTSYAVLGVPPSSTLEAIKRAHKSLSLAYHPDRNSAPAAPAIAAAVNTAFAILSDPTKRAAYDEALAAGSTGSAALAAAGNDPGGPAATGPNIAIKSSRLGLAGSALGGTLGAIVGAGLGAVGGTLAGIYGGAASSVRAAAAGSGYVESAARSVRRACTEAASALAAAAAATADAAHKGGAEGQQPLLSVTTPGFHYATGDLELRIAVPGGALGLGALALPAIPPADLPDMPAFLDLSLKPGQTAIDRLAGCTGQGSAEEVAFGSALAKAAVVYTAAVRKEGQIPEPAQEWSGVASDGSSSTSGGSGEGSGGSGSSGEGDATGMHGGDTYEESADRLRAAAPGGGKPIKSAAALVGLAFSSVGEGVARSRAEAVLRELQLLGCLWEARSRGMGDGEQTEAWVVRRLKALNGVSEAEEGESGVVGAVEAATAAGGGGASPALHAWCRPVRKAAVGAAAGGAEWVHLGQLQLPLSEALLTCPAAAFAPSGSCSGVEVRVAVRGLLKEDKGGREEGAGQQQQQQQPPLLPVLAQVTLALP